MSDGFGAEFRFYIDGWMATREMVTDPENRRAQVEEIATRHSWLVEECEERGRKWMVEVVFSDGEHVRWGTDVDGMVIPVELGLGRLLDAIAERWPTE